MRKVPTPVADLTKMTEIVNWYAAMPGWFKVSDSFHQMFNDKLEDLRPEIAELDTHLFYLDTCELIGDLLIMNIVSDDDPENTDCIALIPADE